MIRSYKRINTIIEDHIEWLLIDISTDKYPGITMAVDSDIYQVYLEDGGGRISAGRTSKQSSIYARCWANGRMVWFHGLIMSGLLDGYEVDHIAKPLSTFIDNRIANLRPVTHQQNMMNSDKQVNNTSGITGVRLKKSTRNWIATIQVNGKGIHLGVFDNIDIAIGAREQAEREYYGEYAFGAGK